MAQTTRKRVVANPGRRNPGRRKMSTKQLAIFGRTSSVRAAAKARLRGKRNPGAKKHRKRTRPAAKARKAAKRSNPGGKIIGFTFGKGTQNNPAGKRSMASKKRRTRKKRAGGYSASKYRTNSPAKRHHRRTHRRNPGEGGGLTGIVTNAVFVIVGALGSKLGAQAVLGTNNTGIIGYVGNAAIGAALWLLTEKVMHNRAAASGVIAGTVVQILLRAINDFTPFGSYVQQLGMGDYQVQSFVTPQVLVDPWNSAAIAIPNGWAPTTMVAPPANAAGAPAGGGNGGGAGMGDYAYGNNLYGGGRGTALY